MNTTTASDILKEVWGPAVKKELDRSARFSDWLDYCAWSCDPTRFAPRSHRRPPKHQPFRTAKRRLSWIKLRAQDTWYMLTHGYEDDARW